MYIRTYESMNLHMYLQTHVHTDVPMSVRMQVRIYTSVCTYMNIVHTLYSYIQKLTSICMYTQHIIHCIFIVYLHTCIYNVCMHQHILVKSSHAL